MGNEELKACACGSTDRSIGYESPQCYWVECGDCGHKTPNESRRSLAIRAWKARDALRAESERFESELKRLGLQYLHALTELGDCCAELEALRSQMREAVSVLGAVQEQFNRYGERFPDGFDSRVFRWVDDAVAGHVFSAQQSAPERVSVPVELLELLRNFTLQHDSGVAGVLRGNIDALLASHAEGGKV